MNIPGPELNLMQGKWDHANTDDPQSKEKDSNVYHPPAETPEWGGPPSDVSVPGPGPHPGLHSMQTVSGDPPNLGFHCPYQYFQCQVANPDCLQLSQYNPLTGPVPGSLDGNQVNTFSAPWFTYEPVLCGMMPLMSNRPGDEQEGMVNPCEAGPVFHTLKPVPTQPEDNLSHNRMDAPYTYNVSMWGTPGQYHQTAQPLYESRGPGPSRPPQAPPAQNVANRKPCHCTRSKCLKFYCECFASGVMCYNCECSNCFNNEEHVLIRQKAIEVRSGRKPDALRTKFVVGSSGEVKVGQNKCCTCKRSGCLKYYCECYEANVRCTSSCKCSGCINFDDHSVLKERTISDENKCPDSVITLGVVENVCGCLLAQAEKAERKAQSSAQAEQMVLEEFGYCLKKITEAMFKSNTQ